MGAGEHSQRGRQGWARAFSHPAGRGGEAGLSQDPAGQLHHPLPRVSHRSKRLWRCCRTTRPRSRPECTCAGTRWVVVRGRVTEQPSPEAVRNWEGTFTDSQRTLWCHWLISEAPRRRSGEAVKIKGKEDRLRDGNWRGLRCRVGRLPAPAASLRIGWPSPGHRLAPHDLPERLAWACLCPCLKTGCLPCFRNIYFSSPENGLLTPLADKRTAFPALGSKAL